MGTMDYPQENDILQSPLLDCIITWLLQRHECTWVEMWVAVMATRGNREWANCQQSTITVSLFPTACQQLPAICLYTETRYTYIHTYTACSAGPAWCMSCGTWCLEVIGTVELHQLLSWSCSSVCSALVTIPKFGSQEFLFFPPDPYVPFFSQCLELLCWLPVGRQWHHHLCFMLYPQKLL